MRIDIITVFPEWFASTAEFGVVGRAIRNGQIELRTWNPRDYATNRHRSVDDRPYGGGPGMVMMTAPLDAAIRAARGEDETVVVSYLSPQGRVLEQDAVRELARRQRLILLCGRYEGIDERLLNHAVDEEWSVGDYVLSGGEPAAAVMIDAIARLIPGVLGHERSAEQDSFMSGLLDCPHYTRPEVYEGEPVPPVLLSGHHAEIDRWRLKQAIGRTYLRRPDMLLQRGLSREEQQLLDEFLAENDQ